MSTASKDLSNTRPLERSEIAQRMANDIPEGWYVNLGIGVPTLIAEHIPADRDVIIHSENGLLGMGPAPQPGAADPWLINAGKQLVTAKKGAAFFNHAESFAMIRGGHLDLCVLGAYEVAENGDLANWTTTADDPAPAVGGAMDLAVGAKHVWVAMEHTTKEGKSKLVRACSYPVTALGVVDRIYTNLAVIDVTARGFEVRDIYSGLGFEALQARTDAKLHRKI